MSGLELSFVTRRGRLTRVGLKKQDEQVLVLDFTQTVDTVVNYISRLTKVLHK